MWGGPYNLSRGSKAQYLCGIIERWWVLIDGTWLEKVRVCGCGLEGSQIHDILSLLLLLGHFADPSVVSHRC